MEIQPVARIARLLMAGVLVWQVVFGGWFMGAPPTVPRVEAAAATTYLQNGSFENGLTNWTAMNYRIDLGVTNIGGCVSVDTTDYTAYANVANDHADTGSFSGFTTQTVTTANALGPADGTYAVRMDLGSGSGTTGFHVVHGPAIVSDGFKGIANQVVTLNWYSAAGADNFAVLGYLLDTDANGDGVESGSAGDCAQYEILDTHGSSVAGWQYATVTIPFTRDFYKFVFVNGTYDASGGRASGATFWVDNISMGTPQTIAFDLSGTTANYGTGWISAPFYVTATADSNLPVTFTSTTTAKCTVTSDGQVTVRAAGTCTLVANQPGGVESGTLWAAAPSVTRSFTITSIAATAQTITYTTPTNRLATAGDFSLGATASSGMAVTYSSSTTGVCTVTSGGTVTMVAPGTCTITAAQAGGVSGGVTYAPASLARSFQVMDVQTITFGALSDKDPTAANFNVSATSSAGLTVSFTSSTTSVCTVTSGGTVDVLTPGTCTITASQAGGATGGITYDAATPVSQSFTVRTGQTITFTAPSPVDEDAADFALTATADSGLAVTYTSNSPSVCTVTSDGTVTMVAYGTCSITAAQAGGTNSGTSYAAATSVTRTFISRRLQTITFPTVTPKDLTAPDFALGASASSGLGVTYSTTTTSVCTVTSSGTVSIVAPGTCTIDADQAGGLTGGITYAVAPTVSESFTVKTPQTITFAALSDMDEDAASFSLSATADSGLGVTYTSSTPSVCTVTGGGIVTLVTYGTCTIVADQSGGTNAGTLYSTANSVTRSFASRRLQTITFGALTDQDVSAADFSVAATASSGLSVTFTATTPSTCTVTSGGTVHIVASGLCSIVAAQTGGVAGGITYAVAPTVSRSFTIRTMQTITFAQPADIDASAAPFTLAATASSGMAVTYTSSTPDVCTVTSSGTVTLVTHGTCTIVAAQSGGVAGGITYAVANPVTRSFASRRAQAITFGALTNRVYNSGDFVVSATASSTLAVTFSSNTPTVCTVTAGTVRMLTVGTCTVVAAQVGGLNATDGFTYAVAPTVSRSFTAQAIPQTLTVPASRTRQDYEPAFRIGATASSGLTPSYSTANVIYCSVDPDGTVRIYVAGTCTVTIAQAGGTNRSTGLIYAAAPNATYQFTIDASTPTPTRTRTLTPTVTNTRTLTPTMTPSPVPLQLKKAAIGASFTLGLLQNGTLVTWGMNKEYQTNIPPCCGSAIDDIAVGTNFAVALKGGAVYGWGSNSRGQITIPKSAKKDITALAAGYAHVLALTKKGTVVSWGNNESGQTKVPKALKNVTSIAAGTQHSIVVKKDGTLTIWGSNASKQAVIPTGLRSVKAASGGFDHTLALKTDGTVVAWGANGFGQSTVPSNVTDIKQISAGSYYSVALGNNGTVYAWGRNDNKQIEIPEGYNNIAVVGAGYVNTVLGLRDGRILAIGAPENDALITRTPTVTPTR